MSAGASPTPAPAPAGPVLVGRERERAMLRESLAAALAGRGSLVLIGGEAGIGKTTLAEASLAEATGQGALALVGRCYDLSETPPYGPWAEALARAPHGDGLPMPPDLGGAEVASQAALLSAVRGYLAALAAQRPLVLLLDDLHWADLASLDLLRALARQLADLPLLLLATYRDDELTRRHPLYQLLPLLEREARATRVDLCRLDAASVGALVAARYAFPAAEAERLTGWLLGRAEGNAFFTTQLLRALEDRGTVRRSGDAWALGDLDAVGLPAPLRQVLDARLDRLGEGARQLLALAAIVGQEVPLDLWAAVAGTDEDGLLDTVERAAEARLLETLSSGEAVRFAHALIREALYEGTSPPLRRRLHRRAAEALLATPAPDPDAVAYHFQRAGDPRAAEWLAGAGHRAASAHAYPTAIERYEAALGRLGAAGDPGERAWLLFSLGAIRRNFAPDRAVAYLDEALALARAVGDAGLVAHATFYLGNARVMEGDYRRGVADSVAGAVAIQALGPAERARLRQRGPVAGLPFWSRDHRSLAASALAEAGRLREAVALGEQLLAEASREVGSEPFAGQTVYRALGAAHAFLGRPDAARQAYTAARAGFQAAGNHQSAMIMAWQLYQFVLEPYYTDDVAALRREAALMTELAARNGEGQLAGVDPRAQQLRRLLLQGEWDVVRRLTEDTVQIGPKSWRLTVMVERGRVARARGEDGVGWDLAAATFPDGAATEPGGLPLALALEVQRLATALALDADDLPTARAWLDAQARWLAWSGAILFRAEWLLQEAQYHRASGDPSAARDHAEAALVQATAPRQPLALLTTHRLVGELATDAGQHAEAEQHLAASWTLVQACEAPYERALTLLALAELHAATGAREHAAATLAEARALLESLGATPALARADVLTARLVAAPSTAGQPRETLPFGLTAREAEVLRLVATGLSDAQAADRLFLSPYTVKAHLRSIYAKLGVDNRAAATAVASDHGLR